MDHIAYRGADLSDRPRGKRERWRARRQPTSWIRCAGHNLDRGFNTAPNAVDTVGLQQVVEVRPVMPTHCPRGCDPKVRAGRDPAADSLGKRAGCRRLIGVVIPADDAWTPRRWFVPGQGPD